MSALLELQTSKNEEVLFAVGEALSFCFGGELTLGRGCLEALQVAHAAPSQVTSAWQARQHTEPGSLLLSCLRSAQVSTLCPCAMWWPSAGVKVSPDDILHTPFASLAAWKQQQEQAAASRAEAQAVAAAPAAAHEQQAQAPAAMEVEGAEAGAAAGSVGPDHAQQSGAQQSGAQQSAALAAAQRRILSVLLEECMVSSRPEVRPGSGACLAGVQPGCWARCGACAFSPHAC